MLVQHIYDREERLSTKKSVNENHSAKQMHGLIRKEKLEKWIKCI